MSKEIKIFTLILMFHFLGCNPKDCAMVPKYLDIEGLNLTVKEIQETYHDGSFSTQPFDTNNSIDFSNLALELVPQLNYYGLNEKARNWRNLFINLAYAGKCPSPGYEGSIEYISDILIFSDKPFLTSGNTTDTLSQYFNISGLNHKNEGVKPIDLVSFTSTQPSVMKKINLALKVKPTGSSEHKFTIIYKQTNGEHYELTTPTIKFN